MEQVWLRGWRVHLAGKSVASTVASDHSEHLHRLCAAPEGPRVAQAIREELVGGLRRDVLLARIRERLGTRALPQYVRYTRRAWLEIEGRHHGPATRAGHAASGGAG